MLRNIDHNSPTYEKNHSIGGTPIVVVLGMHRSGTSLCSQILSLLGVEMASDIGRGRGNEAGHWERWEIVEAHDRVLRILNRDYHSGTHDLPLPNGWWALPEVRVIQRELEDFIRAQLRPGHVVGFKDPRTARLLPLWTPIFRALNLDPRFVLCVRSPTEVARSLKDRDGLPLQVGEYRWTVYNTECWRNLRTEACTIDYDSWFESREETLGRLIAFLSDVVDVDLRTIAHAVDAQIDRSLRHDGLGSGKIRQPALRYFYGLLCRETHDSETRLAINRFVDQFAAFQQIIPFEGAVRAAEDRDNAINMAREASEAAEKAVQAADDAEAAQAAQTAFLQAAVDEANRETAIVRRENKTLHAEIEAARKMNEFSEEAKRYAAVAAEEAHQKIEGLRIRCAAADEARAVAIAEAVQHAAATADVRRELDTLHAQLSEEAQVRDKAVATADRYAAIADEIRRDNAALQLQYAALERQSQAEIREHQEAYADLLKWISSFQNAVIASWSWRLTRPLRRLGIACAALPPPPTALSQTRRDGPAPVSQISTDGLHIKE